MLSSNVSTKPHEKRLSRERETTCIAIRKPKDAQSLKALLAHPELLFDEMLATHVWMNHFKDLEDETFFGPHDPGLWKTRHLKRLSSPPDFEYYEARTRFNQEHRDWVYQKPRTLVRVVRSTEQEQSLADFVKSCRILQLPFSLH